MEAQIKQIVIQAINNSTLDGKGNICWDIHVGFIQNRYTEQGILVPLQEIHDVYDELYTPVVEEPAVEETHIIEEV